MRYGGELKADCASCVGLCCVALQLTRSSAFPVDKAAGEPCGHLTVDHRCGIHDRLREEGWVGCTVFECFGAGQRVSQATFGGRDWRAEPASGRVMFEVFGVMRQLHEMLALLELAARRTDEGLADLVRRVEAAAAGTPEEVLAVDVGRLRAAVGDALRRVSAAVRRPAGAALAGADLVGADLRARDLRRADLRGALLVAADLSGVDLTDADLLGADVRDTEVSGADLSTALFLTQPQVNAMRGDAGTRLPEGLARPPGW